METFQDLSLPIPSRDQLQVIHQSVPQVSNQVDDQGWLSWMWSAVWGWLWGPSGRLNDCLSAFFSADELKGDNMYRYHSLITHCLFPYAFCEKKKILTVAVVKNVKSFVTVSSSPPLLSCQKCSPSTSSVSGTSRCSARRYRPILLSPLKDWI